MVVGFDPTNMRATPRANSLPDSHHCSSARRVSVRCRARWPVFDQFAGEVGICGCGQPGRVCRGSCIHRLPPRATALVGIRRRSCHVMHTERSLEIGSIEHTAGQKDTDRDKGDPITKDYGALGGRTTVTVVVTSPTPPSASMTARRTV